MNFATAALYVVLMLTALACVVLYESWKERQLERRAKKLGMTPPGGFPEWLAGTDDVDMDKMMRRVLYDVSVTLSSVAKDIEAIKSKIANM